MNVIESWEAMNWRKGLSIPKMINHALQEGLFTDITLKIVNGNNTIKTLKTYKMFLMTASPVFEQMILRSDSNKDDAKESSDWGTYNAEENTITLSDVKPDTLQTFLRYIYGQEVILKTVQEAWGLMNMARLYLIPPLMKFCVDFVRNNMSVENATHAYQFAVFYQLDDIKKLSFELIQKNLTKILSFPSTLWVNEGFILDLLKMKKVLAPKIEFVFYFIEKWIEAEVGRRVTMTDVSAKDIRAKLIKSVMPHFSFDCMTITQFAEGPCQSDLLTIEQKFEILSKKALTLEESDSDNETSGRSYVDDIIPVDYENLLTPPEKSPPTENDLSSQIKKPSKRKV